MAWGKILLSDDFQLSFQAWRYAATTKDEKNAADGRFSAAC
jgi:hypothetical protein